MVRTRDIAVVIVGLAVAGFAGAATAQPTSAEQSRPAVYQGAEFTRYGYGSRRDRRMHDNRMNHDRRAQDERDWNWGREHDGMLDRAARPNRQR
jgi:hypothetical protein